MWSIKRGLGKIGRGFKTAKAVYCEHKRHFRVANRLRAQVALDGLADAAGHALALQKRGELQPFDVEFPLATQHWFLVDLWGLGRISPVLEGKITRNIEPVRARCNDGHVRVVIDVYDGRSGPPARLRATFGPQAV